MKKNVWVALTGICLFCAGCAPSYIKVTERKGPTTPLTNIFTLYLDEDCNFSLADSTGYNICLRSHFADTASVSVRNRVEAMLAGRLTTPGTVVYGSCDLLGVKSSNMSVDNSYATFRRLIDSLHVDGILVVQRKDLKREHFESPATNPAPGMGYGRVDLSVPAGRSEFDTGIYSCFLLDPKDLVHPIWTAQMDTRRAGSRHELNRSMTRLLAKTLISEGYTVH
ncbi:MAG TPA: hypothetical protein VHE54_14270 [Puia sp.]|nr:hypothetical protein [Puia sp.]